MKRPILFVLFLFFAAPIFAQQITFEMTALGINFGRLTVTKSQENDSTILYSLKAKGLLKLLVTEINEESVNYVRFVNGKLWQSSHKHYESGKLKEWNTITHDGDSYWVDTNTGKRTFTEIPTVSVLSIYFKQPNSSITRIFSEADAEFISLKHIDANTVEMKNSKSSRSVFYYSNGKIDRMEFYTSVAKVNVKRI